MAEVPFPPALYLGVDSLLDFIILPTQEFLWQSSAVSGAHE